MIHSSSSELATMLSMSNAALGVYPGSGFLDVELFGIDSRNSVGTGCFDYADVAVVAVDVDGRNSWAFGDAHWWAGCIWWIRCAPEARTGICSAASSGVCLRANEMGITKRNQLVALPKGKTARMKLVWSVA
jgi:hypothetical protein